MNKNIFTITNDQGEQLTCEVILTIDSDEFNKSYIVYTDHTVDENGNTKCYSSVYDPTGESLDLNPVETDAEWEMIENVLASAQLKALKEFRNKED